VCEGDGALVVTIDGVLVAEIVADFAEESNEPDLFFESV